MKIKLTKDWYDSGNTRPCGAVVDVSDKVGANLIAAGHIQMHPDTPSRVNPALYDLGCVPSPFSPQTSETFTRIALEIAENEPTEKVSTKKDK